MPTYEYTHLDEPCEKGDVFEVIQSINDSPLAVCPKCKGMIKKIISRTSIKKTKLNSELKDLGFTKLVKRDDGVYENVTQRDGESKYMLRDKPETMPRFDKTIGEYKTFSND
ncbi:MAG: zinc ribbon domain-containing protein [Desulfobacterales bacterium]|nr:zinc ribbon domain-containing protein [Desulfobacterales bacterium]